VFPFLLGFVLMSFDVTKCYHCWLDVFECLKDLMVHIKDFFCGLLQVNDAGMSHAIDAVKYTFIVTVHCDCGYLDEHIREVSQIMGKKLKCCQEAKCF